MQTTELQILLYMDRLMVDVLADQTLLQKGPGHVSRMIAERLFQDFTLIPRDRDARDGACGCSSCAEEEIEHVIYGAQHASDCALHNEPADVPEACDCGAEPGKTPKQHGSEFPPGYEMRQKGPVAYVPPGVAYLAAGLTQLKSNMSQEADAPAPAVLIDEPPVMVNDADEILTTDEPG